MGSRGLRVVVVPANKPGIIGKGRKGLVSRKSDPEISQLHAGLAPVTGEKLKVPVRLSVDVADDDQPLLLPFAPK
jgi:hypothetical protein